MRWDHSDLRFACERAELSCIETQVCANLGSAVIFGSIFWKLGMGQSHINDRIGLLQVREMGRRAKVMTRKDLVGVSVWRFLPVAKIWRNTVGGVEWDSIFPSRDFFFTRHNGV